MQALSESVRCHVDSRHPGVGFLGRQRKLLKTKPPEAECEVYGKSNIMLVLLPNFYNSRFILIKLYIKSKFCSTKLLSDPHNSIQYNRLTNNLIWKQQNLPTWMSYVMKNLKQEQQPTRGRYKDTVLELRALAALAEGLELVPSTDTGQRTASLNSSFLCSNTFFCYPPALACMCGYTFKDIWKQ